MKPGDTTYLGDGAYLHFDGCGFELLASSHDNPTDRVYVDMAYVGTLRRLIDETIGQAEATDQ